MVSVLRPWVMALPLREQGTLIVATRGCDSAPKYPLDSPERQLTAAIRYAVMVPADVREVDSEIGCFMLSMVPNLKLSALEHYPMHWVMHVIHACEAIGYRHPEHRVAFEWRYLYEKMAKSLHMNHESLHQFKARLSEDRIALGTVVQ